LGEGAGEGCYLRDVIALADEELEEAEPLLGKVMEGGKRTGPDPSLEDLRQRFRAEFACLPEKHKALRSPEKYEVQVSPRLEQLRESISQETKQHEITWRTGPADLRT